MDEVPEAGQLLSSDALLASALAAATRRGAPVARRRVFLRWIGWLSWSFVLPIIGLATVLVALVTLASLQLFGQTVVFDTAQTWLTEQMGYTRYPYSQKTAIESTPYDNSPTSSVLPQLQIDRNYSSSELTSSKEAVPVAHQAIQAAQVTPASVSAVNSTPPATPSSSTKPPGAQP